MERMLCMLGLLCVVCGCTAVDTREPIGEKPADITATKDQWAGTWVCDSGPIETPSAITVQVVDSTNGLLRIAWVEKESLETRKADVFLRDANGWTLATLRMLTTDKGDETNNCLWARIEFNGTKALGWAPNAEKIGGLVNSGGLPGVVTNDGHIVHLGHLGSNDLARLTSRTNDVLFNWECPFVLRKAGR